MISDSYNFRKKPAPSVLTFLFGNRRLGALSFGTALFLLLGKPSFAQGDSPTNAPRITQGEGKKNRIIFYNDEQPDASPTPAPSTAPLTTSTPTLPPAANSPAGVTVPHGREATALPTADTAAPAPTIAPTPEPTPILQAATPAPAVKPIAEAAPAPSAAPSQNISAVTAGEPRDTSVSTPAPAVVKHEAPVAAAPTPAPASASSQSLSATTAGEPRDVTSSAVSTPAPVAKVEPTPAPAPVAKVEPTPAPAPVAKVEPTPALVAKVEPAPVAPAPATRVVESAPVPAAQPDPTATDVVTAATSANLSPNPVGDTPPAPSQSVTINLINKLVQRGILTKEDAADMITQAEAEAQVAREQAQADMFAIAQVTAARVASDQAIASANSAPATEESVRVTYIPEPVKTQIKEEVKLELFDEGKIGQGNALRGPQVYLPEWVSRVKPFADLRFRFEGDYYPGNNDNTGAFPNFNAINTGAPYDVSGNQFAPQFNTDQDRNRFRFRARFGAEFDMNENITMGLRVATGENNSPVSANQTIGLANQGQGGQFSKYAIWLDRAFLKYRLGEEPNKNMEVLVGRFDNPFFSTNLIYSDELGFDGFAIQAKYEVAEGVVPFLNAGAFAVFNTDLNFSSNQPAKFQSYDKYLYAAQLGVDWKINKQWQAKVSAAYYYYYNIEGQLSSPFTPQSASDAGDTDNSRPSFAQKGNTYMALRNIVPDASNDFGTINQYQYYGLATPFQDLALTARIDYNGFEPVQVSLIGEFIQNVAFNKSSIDAIAVNNRGALDDSLSDTIGVFEGSPTAWLVELRVGTPALAKRWDWNVNLGYRYIGSDSVVDGFNDSNFGLGGTNMQGFTVGGSLALSSNVWVSLRWFGSDNIAGPSYKMNIIQFDLNAKF